MKYYKHLYFYNNFYYIYFYLNNNFLILANSLELLLNYFISYSSMARLETFQATSFSFSWKSYYYNLVCDFSPYVLLVRNATRCIDHFVGVTMEIIDDAHVRAWLI